VDEMGVTCSTYGIDEKCTVLSENPKRGVLLGVVGVDERISSK
jgi:hypothetical protein